MTESSKAPALRRWALVVVAAVGMSGAAVYVAGATEGIQTHPSDDVLQGPTEDLKAQFTVSQLQWDGEQSRNQGPALSVNSGADRRLLDCGSDTWEQSMLVLAPAGVAYCIEDIDTADPETVNAARILSKRLISGGTFSDAELDVLRLQVLLGYAPEESPEAAQYRDDLNEAWDALTSAEKEHLLNA